ncbi:hypothetical protein [Streptomyces sp. HD]|uniref:hypothetical protein n=1 Tax=Streptomyces sp. HD TaxID=3020892 RepID=UPI00232BCDC6|nr:hypothetical protein [Streptomyces sp. HD]MDC0766320.1 hypothetical protein [Streptomyces sp. HD]
MSVDQLPARVREFVDYLDGLLARLDQGAGWCGVFWQRDPEGMQACLDGREVPPRDVLESLLHDLAAQYGPGGAGPETERARALHIAALAAYDARPGGRDALGDRLDVMLREQRYAAERQAELGRSLAAATSREEADAVRLDLAWARDDHERATARCAELRARMADLDRRAAGGRAEAIRRDREGEGDLFRVDDRFGGEGGRDHLAGGVEGGDGRHPGEGAFSTSVSGHLGPRGESPRRDAQSPADAGDWFEERGTAARQHPQGSDRLAGHPLDPTARTASAAAPTPSERPEAPHTPARTAPGDHPRAPSPAPDLEPAPTPKQRKRRRGSARFAGMVEEEAAPVVVPPTAEPVLPTLPAQPGTTRRTPRGARFAGAADEAPASPRQPQVEPMGAEDRREVARTVQTIVRLRAEGRGGEAHVLLVEAAYWPAVRFPALAADMERAGLGADWATLLWEAASLPAERLVAAADALTAAGRAGDGEQILRQGVARPAGEIGQAVLGLLGEGRHREVRALLDAYVRVRTPEEAARSVAPEPRTLVPLVLAAAQGVSDERHWDLVHALRVAGFTA